MTSAHSEEPKKAPVLTEIYRDAYMTISADPTDILIWLRRTGVPHPTPLDLEQSFRHGSAAMDRLGRTHRVLLVDMREALGRNEPEFDAALRRIRPVVERGLRRIVVLLRSSAGMLQMKRINEEDGVTRMLTMNEGEALKFLRTGAD